MITKEEFLDRLYDLIDDVEHSDQDSFDDQEVEDLICEARIPITRSNGHRTLREGGWQ